LGSMMQARCEKLAAIAPEPRSTPEPRLTKLRLHPSPLLPDDRVGFRRAFPVPDFHTLSSSDASDFTNRLSPLMFFWAGYTYFLIRVI
jgi:hypothetical protein